MKRLFIIAALFVSGLALNAQSVTDTNTAKTLPEQAQQIGQQAYDALSGLSFKPGFQAAPFYLNIGGNSGGGIAVSTIPTNGISAGFAVADIRENGHNDFMDGAVTIQFSGVMTLPLLGWNVNSSVAIGPCIDVSHANAVYNQSTAIFSKGWTLAKNVDLDAFGGTIYISKYSKPGYLLGLNLQWRF